AWLAALAVAVAGAALAGAPVAAWGVAAAVVLALGVVLGVPAVRRRLVTAALMPRVAKLLPRLGDTERIALEAGTVGFDGELFSGRPDWKGLLDFTPPPLSERERAFLAGPVEALCARLDEWEIDRAGDLPAEVWEQLRRDRFFG